MQKTSKPIKILGLIPARGGSKGIPRKNIKKLGDKELIRYTIEAALQSELISHTIVSTDDLDIAEISRKAGVDVPFLRPKKLATDQSPTIDTVLHALDFMKSQNIVYDAVCLLQPTFPFRTPAIIDHAINIFSANKADSLISVREVPHQFNPHWIFMARDNSPFLELAMGDDTIISRRQDLPTCYYRDGSIYISRTATLLTKKSMYGERVSYFRNSDINLNLDTLEDWKKAEAIIEDGYGSD